MAETTGHVGFIKVNATSANFALFQVLDAATAPPSPELFFVWFGPGDTNVPTGPQWMHRALQVSLLRDALTANKTVTVFHDDTSAFVRSLQVNA
jgi:hypothetical protein